MNILEQTGTVTGNASAQSAGVDALGLLNLMFLLAPSRHERAGGGKKLGQEVDGE